MEETTPTVPVSEHAHQRKLMRVHKQDATNAILGGCIKPALQAAACYHIAKMSVLRLEAENCKFQAEEINKQLRNM